MSLSRSRSAILALGALVAVASPAAAQPQTPPAESPPYEAPPPDTGTPTRAPSAPGNRDARRLFQRFAEDAAIVPGGWTEGQLIYTDLGDGDNNQLLAALIAFRVSDQVEAGLRLGYERQAADPGPDGSGLSDIDLYGKYRLHGGASRCALGGLLKVPTGHEEEGLGTGKTDVEGFAACRADLQAVTVTGNVGLRYNGNPDAPLPDSEASVRAGGGLLLPAGAKMTFVIEATYESQRLDGAGADARLTLGWQGVARAPGFGFRGALALPLSDGAPDFQLFFGAVYLY
jgi:hypothetical protein